MSFLNDNTLIIFPDLLPLQVVHFREWSGYTTLYGKYGSGGLYGQVPLQLTGQPAAERFHGVGGGNAVETGSGSLQIKSLTCGQYP